jgi:hypothetical protein
MPKVEVIKDKIRICTGRFIGIIEDEECRALINSPGAGKKVFTSESMPIDLITSACYGKRFIVATSDYMGTGLSRVVFVSPAIRYMSYINGHKNFKCEDDSEYAVKNI